MLFNPSASGPGPRSPYADHAVVQDDLEHSQDEMEVLFTLPAERYERGSVMMTSNLPFSK